MKPITFVTGNMNKATATKRYLSAPMIHKKLELTEIQSLDRHEVVKHKAVEAYKQLRKPVLVEDTSVVFHALGGLPGPFIKWFLQEVGSEGICRLLDEKDRRATAYVVFGYYDGSKHSLGEAKLVGNIAKNPVGNRGFGWDVIFIPNGFTKTLAEFAPEEQDRISLRRRALEDLKKHITL